MHINMGVSLFHSIWTPLKKAKPSLSLLQTFIRVQLILQCAAVIYKYLAIANRSRVSCAHNTLRVFIGLNITP